MCDLIKRVHEASERARIAYNESYQAKCNGDPIGVQENLSKKARIIGSEYEKTLNELRDAMPGYDIIPW